MNTTISSVAPVENLLAEAIRYQTRATRYTQYKLFEKLGKNYFRRLLDLAKLPIFMLHTDLKTICTIYTTTPPTGA